MDGRAAAPPSEWSDKMFSIIKEVGRARLGRLVSAGRKTLETPHFLGITSRGVIPHITQDTFVRDTDINSVYVPLEDFIERGPKNDPPLYQYCSPDGSSALRSFISLSDDTLMVLGARRTPPVAASKANPNTDKTISVCTAVGFRPLSSDDYIEAVESLRPDIIVGLADIPYERALGSKRVERATDRNIEWLADHVKFRKASTPPESKLFASLLPVPCVQQQFYVEALTDDVLNDISGLCLYSLDTLEDLPRALDGLPRLAFTNPKSPHQLLHDILQGIDLHTVPFITEATDAGIALSFDFPISQDTSSQFESTGSPLALGIDMWESTHAVDLSPLRDECECYACTAHHRAFLQHLLMAKEMLGWVLLQIHNHHIMNRFFAGVRQSLSNESFEQDIMAFEKVYESRLPEKTGQGPRIRGYQYKSEGPGEAKRNPVTFAVLNDRKERLAEAEPPAISASANELQAKGFAEKDEA